MELHRSRTMFYTSILMVAGGLILMTFSGSIIRMGIGGGLALLGLGGVYFGLRPLAFAVGADGLHLRMPAIKRLVSWPEIHLLILEQPMQVPEDKHTLAPRLLLVPVAGSPLNDELDLRSPLDQQPCRQVLDVGDFKEGADDVARALAHFGGARFVDARGLPPYAGPTFATRSGGYPQLQVRSLVRQAMIAVASGTPQSRWAAKNQLARPNFGTAPLGYDRTQVDAYLHHLWNALAAAEQQA